MNTLPEDVMERVAHPDSLGEYWEIFIEVGKWGKFKRSDIGRNNIRQMCDIQEATQDEVVWMTTPRFVTNFERKLERKPRLQAFAVGFDRSFKMHATYIDISRPYFDLPSVDPTAEDESHE
jgi:hypothetical protein